MIGEINAEFENIPSANVNVAPGDLVTIRSTRYKKRLLEAHIGKPGSNDNGILLVLMHE
jgi:hypothetical protein